jgi:molybdopterin molybdotransferase
MIPVTEAIAIIIETTKPLPPERVSIASAMGRILAEDIVADSDLPSFNRAQMDGYAVRALDVESAPTRLRIVGEAAAGLGWHNKMNAGEAVRIMTGAPVPQGADSVQQVEVTEELDNGTIVEIGKATTPGQFIVPRAAEVKAGETVLNSGDEINAAMMAALASFGYPEVNVGGRPRVAILATGTELVAVDQKPKPDQIRDSNTYSIGAYAALAGAEVERLPLATDDREALQLTFKDAAARNDVLILSGGVSMGVYDFTKAALRDLGAEIFFERVSLRPGKPTVFARIGETLVFGLPGNPVSVSVTFNLFARTALRALQGARETSMHHETAILSNDVKGSIDRESYLPARLETNADGQLIAVPLKWGGSSDFVSFTRATALVNVAPGFKLVAAGSKVRIARLPG